MKQTRYIGVKLVKSAEPKTRGAYNAMRGWALPKDENHDDAGYFVTFNDGYDTWMPAKAFEKSYRELTGSSFSDALEAVKAGCRIYREGWNGKGMFVVYQPGYPKGIKCNANTAEAWDLEIGDLFKCEPYLQIRMANGSHSMWVPSVNDVLANDWTVL